MFRAKRRYAALWHALFITGLRPCEALGLKWPDIDGNRIRIRRSLSLDSHHKWTLDEPKTDRARRSVVVPAATLQVLEVHKAQQDADRLRARARWVPHELIFCSAYGAPLDWRSVSARYLRPMLRALKVDGMRPYDLRHSCATILLSSGENAKVVSERLGHASVALTLDVYSHVLPDMQERAAQRLGELIPAEPPLRKSIAEP